MNYFSVNINKKYNSNILKNISEGKSSHDIKLWIGLSGHLIYVVKDYIYSWTVVNGWTG